MLEVRRGVEEKEMIWSDKWRVGMTCAVCGSVEQPSGSRCSYCSHKWAHKPIEGSWREYDEVDYHIDEEVKYLEYDTGRS